VNIYGLQKLTLLDYPGHLACTVFLSGCDFRCPYCHNFALACSKLEPLMDDIRLMKFLEGRTGILEGVAITGGEPCLTKELPTLLSSIKKLGLKTKLDTNGNHPDILERLFEKDLVDYIAMDVKNSPGRYAETVGHEYTNLKNITKSIDLIMNSGIEYEFRTTVVNDFHDEDSIERIGEMIEGADKYFLQKFVDRDSVPLEGLSSPPKFTLEKYRKIVKPYVKYVGIRG